jgi:hypothetical protein
MQSLLQNSKQVLYTKSLCQQKSLFITSSFIISWAGIYYTHTTHTTRKKPTNQQQQMKSNYLRIHTSSNTLLPEHSKQKIQAPQPSRSEKHLPHPVWQTQHTPITAQSSFSKSSRPMRISNQQLLICMIIIPIIMQRHYLVSPLPKTCAYQN